MPVPKPCCAAAAGVGPQVYAPRDLPLSSIPGGRMMYQLAAAEVEGAKYAVVALGIANPFLFDNLRSLLLHWGCTEGAHAGWSQPPKGWHTSPGVSTVSRRGRHVGPGGRHQQHQPCRAHPCCACIQAVPDSTLPAYPDPLCPTPACLPLQPAGSLAWETVLGAFAPVMQGEPVIDSAAYSVVLQVPLEGGRDGTGWVGEAGPRRWRVQWWQAGGAAGGEAGCTAGGIAARPQLGCQASSLQTCASFPAHSPALQAPWSCGAASRLC